MSNGIFGNVPSVNPSSVTRRVPAAEGPQAAGAAAPQAAAPGYASDALVRSAPAGAPAAGENAAAREAELRLANAYDADPQAFARNLARATVQDLVSQAS